MKIKLDIEDALFDFGDWAFVHFHTTVPCLDVADVLNRLYHYNLRRIDDMELSGTRWPFYRHEDAVHHLIFFLTERPAEVPGTPWEPGDKLLIIKGETADVEARYIHTDFTTRPQFDAGDLLAKEHADLLDRLLTGFTVVHRLDFDQTPASRKALKELTQAMQLCDSILAYIEQKHLDLGSEERMRMEMLQCLKKIK